MPDLGFCGRSLWSLGCNLCRWLMLWPAQHRQLLCGRVPVFYTPAKRQKQIKYWHFFPLLSLCCGRVFFRCKHIFPHPLKSVTIVSEISKNLLTFVNPYTAGMIVISYTEVIIIFSHPLCDWFYLHTASSLQQLLGTWLGNTDFFPPSGWMLPGCGGLVSRSIWLRLLVGRWPS